MGLVPTQEAARPLEGGSTSKESPEELVVLEKIRELVAYGYGRLELVVRDHEIARIDWQKTLVKKK